MKRAIRLIWRMDYYDPEANVTHTYKTDIVVLPEDAQAFKFWQFKHKGELPDLIGGEWLEEEEPEKGKEEA